MKTLKIAELNPKQMEDWKSVFDQWLMNNFGDCLRAHDFKMDCIDCGNVIMDVVLEIGASGGLQDYTILHVDFDCSNKSEEQIESLKRCMMTYFIRNDYPKSLKGVKLETRIGRVTKC